MALPLCYSRGARLCPTLFERHTPCGEHHLDVTEFILLPQMVIIGDAIGVRPPKRADADNVGPDIVLMVAGGYA